MRIRILAALAFVSVKDVKALYTDFILRKRYSDETIDV